MRQIILDFGVLRLGAWDLPLRVNGYGLMLGIGFLLGILLAQWRARRVGESPEALTHCAILSLIGGIIGARIAYVVQHWESQFADAPNRLAEVLNVTSGLTYYGGVGLATLLVLGYLWVRRLPARRCLDILAVSLMVGLAFGRTGCLLNGCCFGGRCSPNWALAARFPMYSKPLVKCDGRANPFSLSTDAPSPPWVHQWAKGQVAPDPKLLDAAGRLMPPRDFNDEQAAIAEASWSLPVKPAQAIGAASALVIAGLLGAFYRLRKAEGQVFALMLMMYPVTRFVLESIRDDNLHNLSAGVLTHNQYSSIAIFLIGAAMMLAIRRLPPSAGPAARQRAAAPSQPGARPADKPRWNKRS